jgi:hypothetical protein
MCLKEEFKSSYRYVRDMGFLRVLISNMCVFMSVTHLVFIRCQFYKHYTHGIRQKMYNLIQLIHKQVQPLLLRHVSREVL